LADTLPSGASPLPPLIIIAWAGSYGVLSKDGKSLTES
jgi:hypothetical protein